jgi:predicted ATP-grasp superfamily ATP-dependent carboligase
VRVHALAETTGASHVRRSRYLASFVDIAPGDVASQWLDWLSDADGPMVLIACGDPGLEFIARHRAAIEAMGHRAQEANDELLLAMLDKERAYALVGAAGFAVPRTRRIRTAAEAAEVADSFPFPLALKPVHSHRSKLPGKAVVVASADELASVWKASEAAAGGLLATEIIPGPDDAFCSYYSYFDEHDRPLLHLTKRKLRQLPIHFGTGTYHVTAVEPEAEEVGLRLFSAIGLRGLGNVEFKRDARDATLKVIECNLRITAANEEIRIAGIDLVWFIYCRATGRALPDVSRFRESVRQWHPIEDFRAARAYRAAGELTYAGWLRSLAHRQHLAIFSFRDPMPALGSFWPFLRRLRRASRDRRRRRRERDPR